MSEDAWKMLRDLISAVDSHRLTNDNVNERDVYLYLEVENIRRRLA